MQAGDAVVVERTTHETVTVLEMYRYFFESQPPEDFLRRFLAAPTPLRGRKKMEEKYQEYSMQKRLDRKVSPSNE